VELRRKNPGVGAAGKGHALARRARNVGWRALAASTLRKCNDDRIFGMSAEVGFWQLISLPSLLLAVFGALGYFGGVIGQAAVDHVRADVLRLAGDFLSSSTVRSDVAPIVDDILSKGHAGLLSVSFVISLWSGSSAMADYVNTITVAYEMRGVRGALRTRVVALGLYLAAVVAGVLLLPAAILGPRAVVGLASPAAAGDVRSVLHGAYWPGLIVVSVVTVTTLYVVSLPRRVAWLRQVPGAAVAVAMWIGGSVLLRVYVSYKAGTADFYGALAAPLAGLLFFYITAMAVIFGAEVNATLHRRRAEPEAASADPAQPPG
jgi:membrane protein